MPSRTAVTSPLIAPATPVSMRPSPLPSSESSTPKGPLPLPPPALSATPPSLAHLTPLRLVAPSSQPTTALTPRSQALPPILNNSPALDAGHQAVMVRGRPYPSVLEPGLPPSGYCLPFVMPGPALRQSIQPTGEIQQTRRSRVMSHHPYAPSVATALRPLPSRPPPTCNTMLSVVHSHREASEKSRLSAATAPVTTKGAAFYTPRTPAGILAEMPVTPNEIPHFALDYERPSVVHPPPPGASVRSYRHGHRPPPLSAELILRRFQVPKNGWMGVPPLDRTEKWGWKLEVEEEAHSPTVSASEHSDMLQLPRLVCDIKVVDEFGRSVPLNNPHLVRKMQYLTVALTIDSFEPIPRADPEHATPSSVSARPPGGRERLLGQTTQSAKIIEVDGRQVIRAVFDTLSTSHPGKYTLCAKLYAPAKFIFSPEHMGRFLMASLAGHFGAPPSGLVEVLAEAHTGSLVAMVRGGAMDG